jgi:hypothetical protein
MIALVFTITQSLNFLKRNEENKMGFLVLLAAIVIARLAWRFLSRRYTPARFDGSWRSESYKRRIAASSSDYQSRREYASMRGNL